MKAVRFHVGLVTMFGDAVALEAKLMDIMTTRYMNSLLSKIACQHVFYTVM